MPELAELIKAITSADVGGLVQDEIDKAVAEVVDRENPLRQNLPRKAGSGSAYIVTQRTPGSTLALAVSDTDDLPAGDGTYSKVTFSYKTIGVQVKITRRARKVSSSVQDIAREELEAKLNEFRDQEEYYILRGNATSNAKEFDGLDQLIPLTQRVVATTTNGAFTLENVDEAMDLVKGQVNMIICSRTVRRKFKGLLQSFQRFVDVREVDGGFRLMAYNEAPVYVSTQISDTMTFGADKSVSAYTGGSESAMYFLNTNDVFMVDAQKLTAEPLAKVSSQYDAWDIYEDTVLVLRNPMAASMLVRISLA